MIALISRVVGDRALAEDLAQDTFVKAFRNLAAFDTTRRLSSWLLRIAHNTAIDALRRKRPTLISLDAPENGVEEPSQPPQADPAERRALARALEEAMAELRPEYRVAMALRYEEGLAYEEIGHVMGVPEVTARTHVHRARKELARRLGSAGWQPSER